MQLHTFVNKILTGEGQKTLSTPLETISFFEFMWESRPLDTGGGHFQDINKSSPGRIILGIGLVGMNTLSGNAWKILILITIPIKGTKIMWTAYTHPQACWLDITTDFDDVSSAVFPR